MAISPAPPPGDHVQESRLVAELAGHGIEAVLVTDEDDLDAIEATRKPSLALIDFESMTRSQAGSCVRRCSELRLPAIALVPSGRLADVDGGLEVDDFLLSPLRPGELAARAKRVVSRNKSPDSSDMVRVGDLAINTAKFEVSVNDRRASLRFKEYELLLLMAANPGRVYSREALLARIWGYDYLGGTRTVDVHVRRLRSKIEDADHSFIETVWNVGYRFKDIDRRP